MRLQLTLTMEQATQLAPMIQPGRALIGRISREWFDGSNAATGGRLTLEVGSVPESSLPALREAIQRANAPVHKRTRAKRGTGAAAAICGHAQRPGKGGKARAPLSSGGNGQGVGL